MKAIAYKVTNGFRVELANGFGNSRTFAALKEAKAFARANRISLVSAYACDTED